MLFRSPRPPVDIPRVPVTTYVLEKAGKVAERTALVDAITGRRMTYAGLEATRSSEKDTAPSDSPKTTTSRSPARAAATRAFSMKAGIVKRHFAPQSRSWLASSSAVKSGFTVVITAPSWATPWKAMAYSSVLGA